MSYLDEPTPPTITSTKSVYIVRTPRESPRRRDVK
jgi:hypothetical protein